MKFKNYLFQDFLYQLSDLAVKGCSLQVLTNCSGAFLYELGTDDSKYLLIQYCC